jgi:hypothetical protein
MASRLRDVGNPRAGPGMQATSSQKQSNTYWPLAIDRFIGSRATCKRNRAPDYLRARDIISFRLCGRKRDRAFSPHCGPLAQLAEQQTLNLRVDGSIPSRLTTFSQ